MSYPEKAAFALSADGPFADNLEGFTARQAQQEMASEVAHVLNDGGTLVAESGTGTGKTFAYLVPIVQSKSRTIVSTGTKHLQDQIFHRDIPTVSHMLNKPVNAVMLKGRSNYLCPYRLKLNSGQSSIVGKKQNLSFSVIERWASKTEVGDIAEVSEISDQAPIWREVTSTADNCLGGKCPDFKKCFVVKARQKAMEAEVVVVNHHLFFSDLSLKDDGFGELLPNYDAVIFDEAHAISEIASNFFGFYISSFQLSELCRDIVTAESEDRSASDFVSVIPPVERALDGLYQSVASFADQSVELEQVQNAQFQRALETLQVALDALLETLESAAVAGESLERCFNRALHIQSLLDQWISGRDNNLIRWVNVSQRHVRLNGTPMEVSQRFNAVMGRAKSWVFTSATLAIGNDFTAFSDRLGLSHASFRNWVSPYDYPNNALLFLPTDMPDPREREFAASVFEIIYQVTEASNGRAFCLFTSYSMMNAVYKKMKTKSRFPLLLQGESPRSELMDRFQRTSNAVLFGTSSFWEGVDIKGDALSCVIIDKLPFASPGDPVLKSRLQACEEMGGNAFMEIQVPDAAIALKQGAGRLIRSETDRGVLVICDPRVTTKRYGQKFLDSLPPMSITKQMHHVEQFFGEVR